MRITIVLVSKGRMEFLPECLSSIEKALSFPDVDALVIDNGAQELASHFLADWVTKNSEKAQLVRFEKNQNLATEIFKIYTMLDLDWIIAPGDDDVIRHEIFPTIFNLMNANPNLCLIATGAQGIDTAGNVLSDSIRPALGKSSDFPRQLARLFYEPPLVWPATFWRFSRVPKDFQNTRYVFDWWVGNSLVAQNDHMTCSEISLNYRIHKSQESALASNRRKYMEAFLMLDSFIDSEVFTGAINGLTETEIMDFWDCTLELGAIYGSDRHQLGLLNRLSTKLSARNISENLNGQIFLKLLAREGVLIQGKDFENFYGYSQLSASKGKDNFLLAIAPKTCSVVEESYTKCDADVSMRKFIIACRHSKEVQGALKIDCDQLLTLDFADRLDFILYQAITQLEVRGDFGLTLAPSERKLVIGFRKIRQWIPARFLRIVKSSTLNRR